MTVFPACQLDSPLHQTRPGGLRDADAFRRRTAHQAYWTGVLRYLPSVAKVCSMILFVILAGCATTTAIAPTPVACAPKDSPIVPATSTNAALAALDDYRLILTIAAERLSLLDYAGKADAVIQACR